MQSALLLSILLNSQKSARSFSKELIPTINCNIALSILLDVQMRSAL